MLFNCDLLVSCPWDHFTTGQIRQVTLNPYLRPPTRLAQGGYPESFHLKYVRLHCPFLFVVDMGVSWNGGTSKSSTLVGFPLINKPFWGSPIYGNPHMSNRLVRVVTNKQNLFLQIQCRWNSLSVNQDSLNQCHLDNEALCEVLIKAIA